MLACLVLTIVLSIKNYIYSGEPMYTQLCIVFALTPPMVQGFKPELKNTKNFRFFSGLMTTLAVAMLVGALIITM